MVTTTFSLHEFAYSKYFPYVESQSVLSVWPISLSIIFFQLLHAVDYIRTSLFLYV